MRPDDRSSLSTPPSAELIDLQQRLDRIEDKLEDLGNNVSRQATGGSGVGCVGFAMLVYIIVQLGELVKELG